MKLLKNTFIRYMMIAALVIFTIGIILIFLINQHVISSTRNYIISSIEADPSASNDCILILGCKVNNDGSPSLMLNERLEKGIELYHQNASPKLLMSGDHGRINYNEVRTMKDYAVSSGIPSENVFMDHAGFSTYESMYRAQSIFDVDKMVIVTQDYHLPRAVFIARSLGIDARGVAAASLSHPGQTMRDFREVLARCKDFVTTLVKPSPTYLGEKIPITGSGDLTNDD